MSQDKTRKVHMIYSWISTVVILLLGIALVLACLDIYNSGPRPYNPEAISLRFHRISVIVYVCIALILGGFVLGWVMPQEARKPKAQRDAFATLLKLKEKSPSPEGSLAVAIRKERILRASLRVGTLVVFAVLMVGPAIYYSSPSHFTITSVNSDILSAACIALIPAAAGLLLCFLCSILVTKSLQRETDLYKKVIAKAQSITMSTETKRKCRMPIIVFRAAILTVAVVFLVLGLLNGGMKDVLDKAVAICTECIGLG